MGSVKRIRMKPSCVPSRFESQMNKKRKRSLTPDQQEDDNKERGMDEKKRFAVCPMEISTSSFHEGNDKMIILYYLASLIIMMLLLQVHCRNLSNNFSFSELLNKEGVLPSCSSSLEKVHEKAVQVIQHNTQFRDQAVQVQPIHEHVSCQTTQCCAHKVTQTSILKHYRSKHVQFSVAVKDAVSSPIKPIAHQSTATSPIKPSGGKSSKPSSFGQSFKRRKLFFTDEKYDSDVSYTLSDRRSSIDSSLSERSSKTTVDSLQEKVTKDEKLNLKSTLTKINKNPRLYIGIPAELYFIVGLISKHTKLSEKNILLCLMKIRLNKTFSQLADDFDISLSQASKIFCTKVPLIVSMLSPFVKTFTKSTIKKNLPIAFRQKYNKINCIIDCLEIEIQKPKKAIHQALTWSEYKKANTYKYLISCTPDGLVSFVSSGYGGRVSDINLLEHSKFLDSLEPNSYILADRGFKNIEIYLKNRGFTLLRPPSVGAGSKLTKSEAKQTKEIASLRIHVERVIRRIREFSILKPHSVVNLNLLHVLDFCVMTACSLINLQDSLIK